MSSFQWPPLGGAGVTSINGLTGDVTLAAGTGITLTPAGNTITIASTGLTAAITSLNSDTTAAQTITVGTAGTDFAISNPGGGSHVLNLPTASASNRGALSSADWTTFNSKESALTFSTGLTRTVNTVMVNTSQNIATLSNLTTNGFVKTGGGTGALSVSTSVALASEVSGNLPVTNLNSGTSASSSTFWRGDGTWATPAGTGTVTSVGYAVPASSIFGSSGGPVSGAGTLSLTVTGTQGGIPYFDTTSTLSSSGALTNHAIVLGGSTGAPTALGSLGTTSTVLHGNASGAPTFSAVSLTADVSGTLPIANGGTNNGSLGVVAGGIYYGDGSKVVETAAGTSGQYLKSNVASAPSWASFTTPTVQKFTTTGTQTGWLFTVSGWTGTIAVGDTYTNNSNTYSVQGAQTNGTGQTLFMSGTGATSGGTLTKGVSASGPATITFSAKVATATYTPAANVLYLEILMAGGGGGGGPNGTSPGTASAGLPSFFGANILTAGGGSAGATSGAGAAGGSVTISSPATDISSLAGQQGGGQGFTGAANVYPSSGEGGSAPYFGGGGKSGTAGGAGNNATANSGGGGAGAAGNGSVSTSSGSGGGSGGFVNAYCTIAASFPYVIGTGGSGATAGSGGFAGGNGAAGVLIVKEKYQ